MDWVKIKAEHISSEYTDAQVGSLVRFQLLVARYGRIPTDSEIANETSSRTWADTKQVLSNLGAAPEQVASKVLADREQVDSMRVAAKERKRKQRASREMSHVTSQHKIREDKIREDKNTKEIYKEKKAKTNGFLTTEELTEFTSEEITFVKLNKENLDKLITKLGKLETINKIIDLNLYVGGRRGGDKYKNHYLTLLSWYRKDLKEGKNNAGKPNYNC